VTWPSSKYAYHSATCLQGPTKTTKNIIRDSRSLDRNSNQAQSEYKSKPLPVSQFTGRSYKLNITDLHCRNLETDTQQIRHTSAYVAPVGSSTDYALLSKINRSRLTSRCCVQLKGLLQTRNSPVRTADFMTEI